ncbi:hypothetical protein CCHL11_04420 [Colletotrichum chlorophyti]|uniref:Uncharacterized protein n=1 Tax=Colletotrichum chlorophyti TaxID=708187 RepID=A0A1Q8S4H4_9PEZI|nr:hypothetical protein CCHL11_04420 [Colletotrichum chlorophyti]
MFKSPARKARGRYDDYQNKIQQRKAQEEDKSKGEPVWFSRQIEDGHLHRWAILTIEKKYELQLPSTDMSKGVLSKYKFDGSAAPSLEYETRIAAWSLTDEMMEVRQQNHLTAGKEHARDYYICQIGWTTLTEEQVDTECKAANAAFGVASLSFSDCQGFLKYFANRIIKSPEGHALDYGWFVENTGKPYHRLREMKPEAYAREYQFWLESAVCVTAGVAVAGLASSAYYSQPPMAATGDGEAV